MPAHREVGYFLTGEESWTQLNIGPFTLDSLQWITSARIRGGVVWNATDVADFGPFPAFVSGLQYGASGYTPIAVNDGTNYDSWLWLRECRSPSLVTWLDSVGSTANVISEHNSMDEDWYGQKYFSGNTDFYVTIATNPLNTAGVEGAFVVGSVEWMRN